MQIDLIWLSCDVNHTEWNLGEIISVSPNPKALSDFLDQRLLASQAEAFLFWDARLGAPDPVKIMNLIHEPIDVWHAGLLLGTGSQPGDLDFISSHWMFICDPEINKRATSWRLSLQACLLRRSVLEKLGQVDPVFESLDMAGLEMGYRYLKYGAVIVNEPFLLNSAKQNAQFSIPIQDRYSFIGRLYQPLWMKYLLFRRFLSHLPWKEVSAYRRAKEVLSTVPAQRRPGEILQRKMMTSIDNQSPRISVLIPTICRYPYLEKTLQQLQEQSLKPWEVICVDQTPQGERQPGFYERFKDFNIKVIWREQPGQCSARNAGLSQVQGDQVLFLDDDVLIYREYIEQLWRAMILYQADIVQGVWDQSTGEAIAVNDRYYRVADRFATGNGMTTRSILKTVGGFDLHYDRNYRADADLGMRLYRAGAVSILVPGAKEHSLSPSTGGLKYFGASATAKNIKLFHPWPAVTQVYYWMRFLTPRQVREAFILTIIASTAPVKTAQKNTILKEVQHKIKYAFLFPFRLVNSIYSYRMAIQLVKQGPQIPNIWDV